MKRIESKTDRERKNRGGDKTEMMVEIACWCEKEALLDNICTDSSPFVCGAFAPFKWSISSSQRQGAFSCVGAFKLLGCIAEQNLAWWASCCVINI